MIHYHGTPLSGSDTWLELEGKHAFVSYATTKPHLFAEVCQSFALDNGAYSYWKKGQAFDMDGYADFVRQWDRHPGFDWYVIPDVIDGDENDNARLRASWFNAYDGLLAGVPVWHLHEPLDVLQYFVVAYKRVAIGSSGKYAAAGTPQWWGRMTEAMDVLCDEDGRPKVKIHGLRMLDPTIFGHFPFASADSCNVGRNVGIDKAWDRVPYAPASKKDRARILIGRIESHAAAARWNRQRSGVERNLELFG